MKGKLTILLSFFFLFSAFRADNPIVTIFMIGDSTMANKDTTGGNPERGWGMVLPGFFSEGVRIDNHAVNGRSSKSFIDEGRWEKVISQVKKGDYVFIQFGHNDEKADPKRHTDPGTTFDDNLRRFVNETRAKGGIPVLFNSIVRRNFVCPLDESISKDTRHDAGEVKQPQEGDTLFDTHGDYLVSPRKVAQELGITFIDMNKITHNLVQGMGAEESKKLFMWVKPNEVPAFPKGREDNTHLNIYGARVIAGLAADAIAGAIPALAVYVRHYDYVVAQDGSGDFFTIQEAIDAVPDFRKNARTTILVRKGTYKEKVVVPESKINISLIGQDGAILSYDDYADKKNVFGETKGTSGSSTCYIYAPDFYAENITFENTSGPVGQAVACFVSGDRSHFKNCRFLGFQDTLYTYGKCSRQYYEECYIEGTVDFIFGWSTAVFDRCRIHSKAGGYVTAPSTDLGRKYGYVFYNCTLTAAADVTKVYLSRPWRPYAQAVFIHCDLGKHIVPAGWHNWGKKDAEKTVFYAEYDSRGEGANPKARVPFSHQLKNTDGYRIEDVLAGEDGWNPLKAGTAPPAVEAQKVPSYEIEKDLPVFLDKMKQELTYPMAWGNSPSTDFAAWRKSARATVLDAMLTPPPVAQDYDVALVAVEQRSGYEARKIRFNLSGYSRVPAYLLVPEGKGPFPAVVLLHDHGAHFSIGKEKMVRPFGVDSLVLADADTWAHQCYDDQFVGDYLASKGYIVLSVDALFWGERGRKEGVRYESQQALACSFEMLGRSWSGFISYEDLYATDFLASLKNVDNRRIGCIGFSMGAYRAWMLAALSDKIRAGAAVCWMTTTDYQLSAVYGRGKGDSNYANVLPGLRRYLDYPHIASIACPKAMLFFNGSQDKLFPVPAVEDAYSQLRTVWKSQAADDKLVTKLWDLPHFCSKDMQAEILSFFNKQLGR